MTVYSGVETYAFVSYAHKDTPTVKPILEVLAKLGTRLWFDEGLHPANDYTEEIAQKIERSSLVIAMISDHYVNSRYCRDELQFAHSCNKEILTIQLENCTLSAGMKMILNRYQHYNIMNKKSDDIYNDMREILPEAVIEPKGSLPGYLNRCAYYLRFRVIDPGYSIYECSIDECTERCLVDRPLNRYCESYLSFFSQGRHYSFSGLQDTIVLEMIEDVDPIPYSQFLATVRYEIRQDGGETVVDRRVLSQIYREKNRTVRLCQGCEYYPAQGRQCDDRGHRCQRKQMGCVSYESRSYRFD
ncbi:MAG: toll/interleukin-1 receptor domain-containing protein [Clostridia bacterium]|nr:toll/interleukin-1 receptor domain-containing protein [Clostridia bacterium]